jgi:hypothetical protein
MLDVLSVLGCEADLLHGFRQRLHDVPQLRPEFPMRRGY